MKKVIRLTESELTRIIKRIVSETEKPHHKFSKMTRGEFMNEINSLCKEVDDIKDLSCNEINDMEDKWDLLDRSHNSHGIQRSDKFILCGSKIRRFKKNKCEKLNESEYNKPPVKNVIDIETGEYIGTHQYGVGFTPNRIGIEMGYEPHPTSIPNGTKMDRSSMEDRIFKPREYDRLSESVIITDEDYPFPDDANDFGKSELEEIFNNASSIDEANEMIENHYPGYYFTGRNVPHGGVTVEFYSPEGDEITGKYFPGGLGGSGSLRNLERFRKSDDAFYNPSKRY